jgi:hypothetical protein
LQAVDTPLLAAGLFIGLFYLRYQNGKWKTLELVKEKT